MSEKQENFFRALASKYEVDPSLVKAWSMPDKDLKASLRSLFSSANITQHEDKNRTLLEALWRREIKTTEMDYSEQDRDEWYEISHKFEDEHLYLLVDHWSEFQLLLPPDQSPTSWEELVESFTIFPCGTCGKDISTIKQLIECRKHFVLDLRAASERLGNLETFVPGPESIEALPSGIRKYIHDLETRCDPTGDIQSMAQLRQENELLRLALEEYDTPKIDDFIEGVVNEAGHQAKRWGGEHDDSKAPEDWMWLLGWLISKAVQQPEKRLHHIVTSAAALAQWHRQETEGRAKLCRACWDFNCRCEG